MKFLRFTIVTVLSLGFELGLVARGQANHIVTVGLEGSFFNPQITSAQVNDTITFLFEGDIHTVTQSAFNTPCLPLPGGFNSGGAGVGSNLTNPVLSWTLTITNASAPIYYFCEISKPMSHCNAGMVGAINALPDDYNAYLSAARQVTGTPKPTAGAVLTGVGAFATAPPAASTTAPSASIATSQGPAPSNSPLGTPPVTSPSPSATAPNSNAPVTSSPKQMNLGAIVGGTVGGVVAIFLAVLALVMQHQSKQKKKQKQRYDDMPVRTEKRYGGSMGDIRYASSPASHQALFPKARMDDPSWDNYRIGEYRSENGHGAALQRNETFSDDGMRPTRVGETLARQNYDTHLAVEPRRLVPVRPMRSPPPGAPISTNTPSSPNTGSAGNNDTTPNSTLGARADAMRHQRSFTNSSEDGSQTQMAPGQPDPRLVQALAQQVAALLHTSGSGVPAPPTSTTGSRPLPMIVRNLSERVEELDEDMQYPISADGHPPPTYRARQTPLGHVDLRNLQYGGDNKL